MTESSRAARKPATKTQSTALVIHPDAGQPLSKEQRAFNRLSKRIAELERKIVAERGKLDLLIDHFHETVTPLEEALARFWIDLARELSAANARLGLRKKQKEIVGAMILTLCDEAFCVKKPDAEAEALYDEWAETSYREEVRQLTEERKRKLADALRTRFGVDPSDEEDSAEAMARLLRQLEETRAAEEEPSPRRRRKNPKQREREAQLERREALTRKSVRDIYLSLAKVLHPDAVADPAERALREDYMKKATIAYRGGDIAALLKLQLHWVTRDDAAMRALSDEALNLYLPALREQVEQLEQALHSLVLDPRYFPISPVAGMKKVDAFFHMGQRAKVLRMDAVEVAREVEFVRSCRSNSKLVDFARDYLESREIDWELDEALTSVRGG